MRSKTIINSKGEPQATRVEIPIKGGGGALGMSAVVNLTKLINGLKNMNTERDIMAHYYIICGFATCCQLCGFMTEKSTDDLMHSVEHLVDNELARVAAEGKSRQ
ncbi:MAG: hypothetical protein K2N15_09510 [Lachnospiraceae bacterium]|nr:hypothetical protein [Lachnospiraceae bacterium]